MEKCSVCQTTVHKCYIVCDNDCGRKYCSDACADADINHHKSTSNSPSLWQTLSKIMSKFF